MFRRKSAATASMAALGCAAIALLIGAPDAALAQGNPTMTNVIPDSESATLQAKIVAIDPATRAVTLAGASGEQVTLTAGPVVRLELLKVGQRVNAQYYRSVAFVVKPPSGGTGTPITDDQIAQIVAQPAQAPGGIGVRLTKISGTVVGIDVAARRIDIVNPSGGGIYTVDVTDPSRVAMLGSLKVGDTITAVISQALAVSIEPAPRGFF
ncbi:MAG TPA: hypothetical protein VMB73_09420 [Acetobacteraceae bacterium]|jgi:hypothetical protein|nr:hypothetical protein [Acetobacteraceae bacterium]